MQDTVRTAAYGQDNPVIFALTGQTVFRLNAGRLVLVFQIGKNTGMKPGTFHTGNPGK